MATTLTETAIRRATLEAAQQGRRELRDPQHVGLWLRIGKSGTRTWCLRARDASGPHWFTLGQYPRMQLAAARRAADAMLVRVRAGGSPIAERRQKQGTATLADSLAAMLDLYGAQRGPELRTWARSRQRIETVFAPLLLRSLASLTAIDFQRTADNWKSKQTAGAAVRSLRPAIKWLAQRGHCDKHVADIAQPATSRRRARYLSSNELRQLLATLESTQRYRTYANCCRLMLMVGTRLGETCHARWFQVDLEAGLWTVHRAKTKDGRKDTLPLPRQASALLAAIKPADARPDDLLFPSEAGKVLLGWDRATKFFMAESGTADWHRHDLRRTCATMLGELGAAPHVIEAVLGHTIHSSLAATYNRSRYFSEVLVALQALADHYDRVVAGTGCKVVPLARPA
jgi:integrase